MSYIEKYKWPLQFLLSMVISTLMQDNIQKTVVLSLLWVISFHPLKKTEILFFLISSTVFTFSNFGALENSVFEFTNKDILLMPYNELFMWGFYCLNAHRFLGVKNICVFQLKKVFLYSCSFALVFSIVHEELLLTFVLSVLLLFALFIFKNSHTYKYIAYFLFMGSVIESSGLTFNLWYYPHTKFFLVPLWAPFMWANIGLIMSLITALFFKSRNTSLP